MVEVIRSIANPRIRRLRALRHKKYRRTAGLFLAEGLRLGLEALDEGWTPAAVAYAAGREEHAGVRRLIQAAGEALPCTSEVLSSLSGKDNPQAVVSAFPVRHRTLAQVSQGLVLAAERLRDPGNLGTLLRACDGAGAVALVLVGTCADPFSPEAVRASMGAVFTVPVAMAQPAEFLEWARARHLVGAALDPAACDYRVGPWPHDTVILLGNEGEGLPADLKAACRRLVRIPMRGRADSLNVAMAGTLLLYEAIRSR
ncbi:MAG: RNA methyltransferase [Sphingomonadaceae bacterium]|uniref:TrmH family RNA methyltransferase n=1 Tax=Thermaurantiacus sp. TaxID=2820283 RepID=UPI00298EE9B7|nr:RNA methyltransferase [Thermaurantiacus sp.]MCS6986217.1 RNA methyltransferase [Sphingomonadaceae bacterium]MDW8415874.1 RNA methyltransferase [Thermaurantiacus sp.]